MSQKSTRYDSSQIEVLQGLDAVRKRPGMYVGSADGRGLHQLVFAVADRPVNEVLTGRAGCVEVTLTPDGGVRVADDGPGVPFQGSEGSGGGGLEALLTCLPARARAGGGGGGGMPFSRRTPLLSHSYIELSVTNGLSSRLTAEVRREGVRWVQEFARAVAVTPPTDTGPTAGTGTTITFWPDSDIFGTAECSFDELAERFRELAFLNRGLHISLTDLRRPAEPRSARFRSPGGARDFVAFLDVQAGAPAGPEVIGFVREDERMAGAMEVAFQWRGSGAERVRSFANSLPTPGGGTHEEGFRDGVAAAVNAYARQQKLLTETDPGLDTDRISEGLTAIVSVKLDHPELVGATRGVLGNVAVRGCVGQAVQEHLGRWLEEHPEQAAAVVGRIVQGARRV